MHITNGQRVRLGTISVVAQPQPLHRQTNKVGHLNQVAVVTVRSPNASFLD
uniref:Uncharacterized protein n=1 Tax=Parascaris univalens TaxID=6257 RepID=A0A915C5D1_PARUN